MFTELAYFKIESKFRFQHVIELSEVLNYLAVILPSHTNRGCGKQLARYMTSSTAHPGIFGYSRYVYEAVFLNQGRQR